MFSNNIGDRVGWKAGGNISPMRALVPSAAKTVSQVTATTDQAIGISGQSTRNVNYSTLASAYHAIADDPVQVNNSTELPCLLEAGEAITVNDYINFDSSGRGVVAQIDEFSFGIATQAATGAGDKFQFLWLGMAIREAT